MFRVGRDSRCATAGRLKSGSRAIYAIVAPGGGADGRWKEGCSGGVTRSAIEHIVISRYNLGGQFMGALSTSGVCGSEIRAPHSQGGLDAPEKELGAPRRFIMTAQERTLRSAPTNKGEAIKVLGCSFRQR